MLPRTPDKVIVPPIKCQGIKTKLVPFIMEQIAWSGEGRWIEPFLGSGVVLFTVRPQRALISDVNPHIIAFYQALSNGSITPQMVREHLSKEGEALKKNGKMDKQSYYYDVRDRFNETANSLDFLFLSRACFNGLMRFNKKGAFNVPFCRKPDRFSRSYITKIVNQVKTIQSVMQGKAWEFRVGDWRETLAMAKNGDFVYADPPYIGRHTDYFNQWSEIQAQELAHTIQQIPCGFALSMWKANRYRINQHLDDYRDKTVERTQSHFYHVGATENLRNSMEEALLIRRGYEAIPTNAEMETSPLFAQLSLAI